MIMFTGQRFEGCPRETRSFRGEIRQVLYSSRAAIRKLLVMSSTTQIAPKGSDRSLRILIADDHPIVRKTLRKIIEDNPRLQAGRGCV
jgi:hypothetical protein